MRRVPSVSQGQDMWATLELAGMFLSCQTEAGVRCGQHHALGTWWGRSRARHIGCLGCVTSNLKTSEATSWASVRAPPDGKRQQALRGRAGAW